MCAPCVSPSPCRVICESRVLCLCNRAIEPCSRAVRSHPRRGEEESKAPRQPRRPCICFCKARRRDCTLVVPVTILLRSRSRREACRLGWPLGWLFLIRWGSGLWLRNSNLDEGGRLSFGGAALRILRRVSCVGDCGLVCLFLELIDGEETERAGGRELRSGEAGIGSGRSDERSTSSVSLPTVSPP